MTLFQAGHILRYWVLGLQLMNFKEVQFNALSNAHSVLQYNRVESFSHLFGHIFNFFNVYNIAMISLNFSCLFTYLPHWSVSCTRPWSYLFPSAHGRSMNISWLNKERTQNCLFAAGWRWSMKIKVTSFRREGHKGPRTLPDSLLFWLFPP